MAFQTFDSTAVQSTANSLRTINNLITAGCDQTQSKVIGLSGSWRGAGANSAMNAVGKAFANAIPRQQVLNNYVVVLEKLINPNYIEAEDVNKRLSSVFKG